MPESRLHKTKAGFGFLPMSGDNRGLTLYNPIYINYTCIILFKHGGCKYWSIWLCRFLGSHLDQIRIVVDLMFFVPIFGQAVRLVFILCLSVCGSFGFSGYYYFWSCWSRELGIFSVTVLVTCFWSQHFRLWLVFGNVDALCIFPF